jgi:hypothetical protein
MFLNRTEELFKPRIIRFYGFFVTMKMSLANSFEIEIEIEKWHL